MSRDPTTVKMGIEFGDIPFIVKVPVEVWSEEGSKNDYGVPMEPDRSGIEIDGHIEIRSDQPDSDWIVESVWNSCFPSFDLREKLDYDTVKQYASEKIAEKHACKI